MKRNNRLLALAVSVLIAAGALSGCAAKEETTTAAPETTTEAPATTVGAETTEATEAAPEGLVPEDDATLTIWETDGVELDYVKAMAEKFKAIYPTVRFKTDPVNFTDTPPKIALDGPAGVGADIFAAPHDHLGEMVVGGHVLPNDITADDIKNNFMPAAATGVTYDGTLYGYPTGIETYALFYNKDLVPTPATTIAELSTFSETWNSAKDNKYTMMWEAGNAYFSYAFWAGYGMKLFGDLGNDREVVPFASEDGIKVGEMFKSVLHDKIFPVNSGDTTYDAMMQGFTEGKTPYIINGPWGISDLKKAGVNFGITTLPKLDNGEVPASFSGVRAFYVSAYSQYPNAAKLFAQFLTTKENLLERYNITSQLPPHKELVDSISDEHLKGILQQAAYAVPMPSIPEMASFWTSFPTALQNIWNGDGTNVKAELDAAVEGMKATYQ